jgi:hypothetical protein
LAGRVVSGTLSLLDTGDLHLDSPVEGLSSEAPAEVFTPLRGATTHAWCAVVDAATLDPGGERTVALA